jgi:hypothetical protein
MRVLNKIVVLLLLPVFLVSSPALAQQVHVVDLAAMSRAVAEKVNQENTHRELLLRTLNRADVREVAGRMGLSVERAESTVATLDGEELSHLAGYADGVEASLAGGANVVVISVTTLLLALILLVLIVK